MDSVIFYLFRFIPDITSSGRTRVNVIPKSWSHAGPENCYFFSIYSGFSCDSTNLIVSSQNAAWVNLQTVYYIHGAFVKRVNIQAQYTRCFVDDDAMYLDQL